MLSLVFGISEVSTCVAAGWGGSIPEVKHNCVACFPPKRFDGGRCLKFPQFCLDSFVKGIDLFVTDLLWRSDDCEEIGLSQNGGPIGFLWLYPLIQPNRDCGPVPNGGFQEFLAAYGFRAHGLHPEDRLSLKSQRQHVGHASRGLQFLFMGSSLGLFLPPPPRIR